LSRLEIRKGTAQAVPFFFLISLAGCDTVALAVSEGPMRRLVFTILIFGGMSIAQQAPTPDPSSATPAAGPAATAPAPKQPVISQTARLAAAKTVYIWKIESHNDIPFNVIANGFDGWAKYVVISDPAKADLIIEVSATEREDSGFAVSSNTSTGINNGKSDESNKTVKTFTTSMIRMVVIDTHTKTPLWAGNEQPRNAARKNKTEDNLVDAAQLLFQHFHDRVEPPPIQ